MSDSAIQTEMRRRIRNHMLTSIAGIVGGIAVMGAGSGAVAAIARVPGILRALSTVWRHDFIVVRVDLETARVKRHSRHCDPEPPVRGVSCATGLG